MAARQALLYRGSLLHEASTLGEAGLEHGSVVEVRLGAPPQHMITIREGGDPNRRALGVMVASERPPPRVSLPAGQEGIVNRRQGALLGSATASSPDSVGGPSTSIPAEATGISSSLAALPELIGGEIRFDPPVGGSSCQGGGVIWYCTQPSNPHRCSARAARSSDGHGAAADILARSGTLSRTRLGPKAQWWDVELVGCEVSLSHA